MNLASIFIFFDFTTSSNSNLSDKLIIDAVNSKKTGLSQNASKQEIATHIIAYWNVAQTNNNANVTYTYHHHTTSGDIHTNDSTVKNGGLADSYLPTTAGGCYSGTHVACGGTIRHTGGEQHDGYWTFHHVCNKCGKDYPSSGTAQWSQDHPCSDGIGCNRVISTMQRTCGYSEGQIVKAIITY